MRSNEFRIIRSGTGSSELREILATALAVNRRRVSLPVAFIERKCPDLGELAEILRLSDQNGYWTNFGPVCSLLESTLARYLNLPPSRAVVMCSSGTAALFTLIALKQCRAGRKLRAADIGAS